MNFCCYIGHGAARVAVMGFDPSKPNEEQTKKMGAYVEQAMQRGALGMSSGLIYPPGMWTTTEELVELCKIVKKYGGLYASHIRMQPCERRAGPYLALTSHTQQGGFHSTHAGQVRQRTEAILVGGSH